MSPKVPMPTPEDMSVDARANQTFMDTLFDTDGKPNSEAHAVPEIEGLEDDETDDEA